jgi:hypothetical protein
MAGCIVLTGQEAPESRLKLRDDLWKKFMSADGIAGWLGSPIPEERWT